MTNKLIYLYSGVRGVLKHEGVMSLLKRGLGFLSHFFFVLENYYVLVSDYKDVDQEITADYLPRADNHCWRVISSNQDVDDLKADGFEMGAYELNLRIFVDKGAVAFCDFVGKELAHFSVMADNPRGKDAVEPLPVYPDFENGQIIVGRAFTLPKFRRLHLRKCNGHLMRKYLHPRGVTGAKYPIRVNNYPALANALQPPEKRITARCRYIKILWFKHLKEIDMGSTHPQEIIAKLSKQNT